MRYRKRPAEVDAVLNDGTWSTIIYWLDKVGHGRVPLGQRPPVTRNSDGSLNIDTGDLIETAQVGDWLLRDVAGELYPCRGDVFAETYEPVAA